MFRPYSLKSIAIWTGGAWAGNQAYYRAKARYIGRRFSGSADVPLHIRALANQWDGIERTFREFCELTQKLDWIKPNKQWDMTDFVRFFVFADWIISQRTKLK